jgi:hypothetical protein
MERAETKLMPDEQTPELWELSRQIRDYGHNPRHIERLFSARFDWHQLWTALNIIDDIDLAIKAYVDADFPFLQRRESNTFESSESFRRYSCSKMRFAISSRSSFPAIR